MADLMAALKNADAAGDTESAKRIAAMIKQDNQSFVQTAKDVVTGTDRETRATRELPELSDSGLLAGRDMGMSDIPVVAALTTMSDPQEIANTLTANYPEIGIQYDEKGNMFATNNKTGARAMLNAPGISGQDVLQGLGLAAAFSGSGRVMQGAKGLARVGQVAAQSGGTSAAVEGLQAGVGGDFDITNVLIDTISAGAFEAVPAILTAFKDKAGKEAAALGEEALTSEASRVASDMSPEAQQLRQTEVLEGIQSAVEAKPKQKQPALVSLGEATGVDEEAVKAAERLGVSESLMPSQVSINPQYIEIEQGLASIPGSKLSANRKESIRVVAQRADDLITELGGTTDKAELSERLKTTITSTIDSMDKQASDLYDEIATSIPKDTKVDMSDIARQLGDEASILGGSDKLEAIEKRILSLAKGGSKKVFDPAKGQVSKKTGVSYALVDKERKKIGEAIRKKSGPYKDMSSGTLKRLYGMLTEVQEKAAGSLGADDLWNTAKSLVSQRKTLEDQSIALLGKKLSDSIMPKVGRAVKKLSSGDYKDFDTLMESIPPGMRQEVMVSALNDVFTLGSRAEKQLSVPGFVDWFESVKRSGPLMSRVMKHLPEEAGQRLNDLYKVSKGMREAGKERITTGRISALFDNFADDGGMVSKLYQTGKRVAAAEGATSSVGMPGVGATGVIVGALSKSSKDPLVKSADDLLSSPEFMNAAKSYADRSARAAQKRQAANKALEKSDKYQRWLENVDRATYRNVIRIGLMEYLGETEIENEMPKSNQ